MHSVKASSPEKEQQRLLYDTGNDCKFFGKGWHIYHQRNGKFITLDGTLSGMKSTKNLPMVTAVKDIDAPTGTKLLGIGLSAYGDNPDQDVSSANPNVFVCNIYEHSKQRGGRQSLLIDSRVIPIEILPYTYIREPKTEEIYTLLIVW